VRGLKSAAKSPKDGEDELNATVAAEIIDRLDRLQEDVADIKESSYRIELRQLDELERRCPDGCLCDACCTAARAFAFGHWNLRSLTEN
jgi:hypothetical protein